MKKAAKVLLRRRNCLLHSNDIAEWLCNDLVFVGVNHEARAFGAQFKNIVSVFAQQSRYLMGLGNLLTCALPKPADATRVPAVISLRPTSIESLRCTQICSEPLQQRVQHHVIFTRQDPLPPQSIRGAKEAVTISGGFVPFRQNQSNQSLAHGLVLFYGASENATIRRSQG